MSNDAERAAMVTKIQALARTYESQEEMCAVVHIRTPADKGNLQEALLAAKGAAVAREMRDKIVGLVNAFWPRDK